MTRSQPLVSVLVPTYNGAAYLQATLESIRAQTHRHVEVIIRDDGSTDATLSIAERFAAADRRFRVVAAGTQSGGFANYLALAALAEGNFIKYCNQDDLLDPGCIRALLAPMIAHPRVVLSTSSRRLIDGAGTELPPRAYTAPLTAENQILGGHSVIRHTLHTLLNQIGEPSTTLYRRRLVAPETMFDFAGQTFHVNCDLALWLSLLTQGELAFHAAPLSSFRIHDSQFSARPSAILEGSLEWVDFLTLGLREGLIEHGPPLIAAGNRQLITLHQNLGAVLSQDSVALRAFVGPLCAGIAATERLVAAQGPSSAA